MNAPNPYAPPVTSEAAPAAPAQAEHIAGQEARIAEALRRLNEHVADPERLLEDRRLVGARVRIPTYVMAGLCVAAIAITVVQQQLIFIPLLVMFALLTLILLLADLLLLPRHNATDPLTALKGAWQAAKRGRAGYYLASLCPTGREEQVSAPRPGEGLFAMGDEAQVRAFLRQWAASGRGYVRAARVRKLELVEKNADVAVEKNADVAVVRAELTLLALPQWANVLTLVLFLAVRYVGLIAALVLYYALRKRRKLTVEKVLLRAEGNGLWYLLSGKLG